MKKIPFLLCLFIGWQNYAFSQDNKQSGDSGSNIKVHIPLIQGMIFGPVYNNWQKTPQGLSVKSSSNIGYDLGLLAKIASMGSHVFLRSGVVFSIVNLHTDYQFLNFDESGNPLPSSKAPAGFKRNKTSMTYLEVPLDLAFSTNRYGWSAGIGARAGYAIDIHTKLVEADGTVIKYKYTEGFNRVRLGLSARLGYDWFNLYARYDLTSTFKGTKAPDAPLYALGILLGRF